MAFMWTRIWWVRPVTSSTSSRASRPLTAKPDEGAAEIVPVIETPVMGDGVFPMIHIDAAFDGGTIFSGDRQIDGAGFFWFTSNKREIFAAYLFFCSHGGEKCAAYFMFGDQQKTGGVAV